MGERESGREGRGEGRKGREGEISFSSEKRSMETMKEHKTLKEELMHMTGMEGTVLRSHFSTKQDSSTATCLMVLVTETNQTEYILRKKHIRLEKKCQYSFHPYFPLMMQI